MRLIRVHNRIKVHCIHYKFIKENKTKYATGNEHSIHILQLKLSKLSHPMPPILHLLTQFCQLASKNECSFCSLQLLQLLFGQLKTVRYNNQIQCSGIDFTTTTTKINSLCQLQSYGNLISDSQLFSDLGICPFLTRHNQATVTSVSLTTFVI